MIALFVVLMSIQTIAFAQEAHHRNHVAHLIRTHLSTHAAPAKKLSAAMAVVKSGEITKKLNYGQSKLVDSKTSTEASLDSPDVRNAVFGLILDPADADAPSEGCFGSACAIVHDAHVEISHNHPTKKVKDKYKADPRFDPNSSIIIPFLEENTASSTPTPPQAGQAQVDMSTSVFNQSGQTVSGKQTNVVAGNRSVAVGGNVSGNIITGNNARVIRTQETYVENSAADVSDSVFNQRGQKVTGEQTNIAGNINTSGSAFIRGEVNTGGGDFVGRDKTVIGDEVRGDKISGDKITGSKIVRKTTTTSTAALRLGKKQNDGSGDKVSGDVISVGNISNSSGVVFGKNASVTTVVNSVSATHPTKWRFQEGPTTIGSGENAVTFAKIQEGHTVLNNKWHLERMIGGLESFLSSDSVNEWDADGIADMKEHYEALKSSYDQVKGSTNPLDYKGCISIIDQLKVYTDYVAGRTPVDGFDA